VSVVWQGATGVRYHYHEYDPDHTSWYAVPGNYIFAMLTPAGWQAIYVGETESFKQRIPSHERWEAARRHGATHVHARVNNAGEQARRAEESDLIRALDPPCNRALVPDAVILSPAPQVRAQGSLRVIQMGRQLGPSGSKDL
jgi:hypothetical protein